MKKLIFFFFLWTAVLSFATPIYKEFTISRWVEVYSVEEYDAGGNILYKKDSKGNEYWYEYDAEENKIHGKRSDGDEWWSEYDDKGNEIHVKWADGDELWYEYDGKGNEIHEKWSGGTEYWYEYEFHADGKVKKRIRYKRA